MVECDYCDSLAVVDSPTVFGHWAYLCKRHVVTAGVPGTKMATRVTQVSA